MQPIFDWTLLPRQATAHRALLLGLLTLCVACGGEPTPPRVTVVSVVVTSPTSTIASAGTIQLQASVRGSDGTILSDRPITWTTTDPLVASVTQAGLVSAGVVRSGSSRHVVIAASAEGVKGDVMLEVLPIPVAHLVLSATTALLRVGEKLQLTASPRDSSDLPLTERSVIWTSSDAAVATVNDQGMLTAVAAGTAIIEARVGNVTARADVTVPLVPALTFSLEGAHPYPVRGDQVTFTWQSVGVASCEATGAWSGPRSLHGSAQVILESAGSRSWSLRCAGPGGEVQRSVSLVVRLPVSTRSYDTFKDNGVAQTTLPVFHGVNSYGDFLGTGAVGLFSAEGMYNRDNETPTTAKRAAFNWWTLQPDRTWRRATVAVTAEAPSCVHPRKVLVTEINGDRRPDLLVMCHGFDAPPYAGEPNVALVSQHDGSYRQRLMSTEVRYFHGGTTCDLDRNGDVELITADGGQIRVYDIAVDGTASYRASHPLSGSMGNLYSVECVDVDEDGELDILAGGHEHGSAATRVWFGQGNNTYRMAIIPAIFGEGTVLDFTVTGTGPTRTLWVLRTSGGDGPSYVGNVLQRVDPRTMVSQIAFSSRQVEQLAFVVPYTRDGVLYIGAETNGLLPSGGRGWEVRVTP